MMNDLTPGWRRPRANAITFTTEEQAEGVARSIVRWWADEEAGGKRGIWFRLVVTRSEVVAALERVPGAGVWFCEPGNSWNARPNARAVHLLSCLVSLIEQPASIAVVAGQGGLHTKKPCSTSTAATIIAKCNARVIQDRVEEFEEHIRRAA